MLAWEIHTNIVHKENSFSGSFETFKILKQNAYLDNSLQFYLKLFCLIVHFRVVQLNSVLHELAPVVYLTLEEESTYHEEMKKNEVLRQKRAMQSSLLRT